MYDRIEPIIVFGRGAYFNAKEAALIKQYKIVAFLDNSAKKRYHDDVYDCEVYPAKDVMSILPSDTKIFCMSVQYVSMCMQLLMLGVDEERVCFGVNLYPIHNSDRALFSGREKLEAHEGRLHYFEGDGTDHIIRDENDLKELKKQSILHQHPEINRILELPILPASNIFGCEYGTAVDRYYIEQFLDQHSSLIKGTVMEIASDGYIKRFGRDVDKAIVLHVNGINGAYKGNFETGEGISDNMVDCLICTQTLQYIYDLKAAVLNIYRMLRSRGTGLLTLPGIKSLSPGDSEAYGEYWSFTEDSANRLFSEVFGSENVEVVSHGNVKVSMAYLYGIPLEYMLKEDMDHSDHQFPFLITVRVNKK